MFFFVFYVFRCQKKDGKKHLHIFYKRNIAFDMFFFESSVVKDWCVVYFDGRNISPLDVLTQMVLGLPERIVTPNAAERSELSTDGARSRHTPPTTPLGADNLFGKCPIRQITQRTIINRIIIQRRYDCFN